MRPEFKYKSYHDNLPCDCPALDLQPTNSIAYRWIFEDVAHYNNYHPVLLIDPTRLNLKEDCHKMCNGYSLSLYNSMSKAEKALKRFLDHKPMLAKQLGNCIGEVQLTINDGEADKPSKSSGHFNFHEYKDITLSYKFLKKV